MDGYTAERRANKLEVIGAIADSVQSRTSSHRFLDSCGHPEDYFMPGDDHTRVTEIIANFNALYWTKAALPREKGYRKLREMIEELFAGIYP